MTKEDFQKLLDELDVISEYELRGDDYEKIEITEINGFTAKGVWVQERVFLPFSQMKCDMDGVVFLRSWLAARYF